MTENIKLEDFAIGKTQSKSEDILSTIGVIGCGNMGQELISYFSQQGFDVRFVDTSDEMIAERYKKIETVLDAKIAKWGLTEGEKKGVLNRIKGSSDYKILKDCDIVIEAIETVSKMSNLTIRKEILAKIEEIVSDNCVIASNTSTLMISELSEDLCKPERTLAMHFISPVEDVKIIELVAHAKTTKKAYNTATKFKILLDISLDLLNLLIE